MKKYKVTHRTKVFTENGMLEPDGFSSVAFFNEGSDVAYVMKDIKIPAGEEKAFINEKDTVIADNISVSFATTTGPRVVALKIYYEEV